MKFAKQRKPKRKVSLYAVFYETLRFLDETDKFRTELKKRLIEEATGEKQ